MSSQQHKINFILSPVMIKIDLYNRMCMFINTAFFFNFQKKLVTISSYKTQSKITKYI